MRAVVRCWIGTSVLPGKHPREGGHMTRRNTLRDHDSSTRFTTPSSQTATLHSQVWYGYTLVIPSFNLLY